MLNHYLCCLMCVQNVQLRTSRILLGIKAVAQNKSRTSSVNFGGKKIQIYTLENQCISSKDSQF